MLIQEISDVQPDRFYVVLGIISLEAEDWRESLELFCCSRVKPAWLGWSERVCGLES